MPTKKPLEKEVRTKPKKAKKEKDGGWGIGTTYDVVQATASPERVKKSAPIPKPDKIFEYLKEHLQLEILNGGFTDPNSRSVRIILKGEVIAEAGFDVVQKREYEG